MTDSRKWRSTPEMLIYLKLKGTVKIPTTNLGYKTMYMWTTVLASEYNNDRQREISICPPKPEIITV